MFTATWDYTLSFFHVLSKAPKSLTVTWLTLCISLFFQKSTSQATGEVAQLKEEMARMDLAQALAMVDGLACIKAMKNIG